LTQATRGRLLIIGVDGATFDLIEPWAKAGYLPHLAHWMSRGSYGSLCSTIPPQSPQAWATFQTGLKPGKHGVFDFSELRIDRPRTPYSALSMGGTPFWQWLGDQGDRVVVVNVLFSYPPQPVNGLLISGKLTPVGATFTYPPELGREIENRFGEYITDLSPRHLPSTQRVTPQVYLARLLDMLARRTHVTDYLLGQYEWDTAIVVFTALDTVQHFFWHYMDASHPLHDPDAPEELRAAILHTYRMVDQTVGRLTACLSEEDSLLIVSDHGFGPLHKAVNLTRWLISQNLLVPRECAKSQDLSSFITRLKVKAAPVAPRTLWRAAGRLIGRPLDRINPLPYQRMPIDWNRTRAYAIGRAGSIFINLRGREPLGTVCPGQEYEDLRQSIRQALKTWRNPDTDQPVVAEVYCREDLYDGPYVEKAPDLIIQWQDYAYPCPRPGNSNQPMFYRAPSAYSGMWLTGYHRPAGVLLAAGPHIRQGVTMINAHIADVAPVALHLRCAPIPDNMDGGVLTELIRPEWLDAHPPHYVQSRAATTPIDQAEAIYSSEEASQIEERLRSLGYF
jgi:predicted AlkP superfamily phosphohydrolase/phosphomutase